MPPPPSSLLRSTALFPISSSISFDFLSSVADHKYIEGVVCYEDFIPSMRIVHSNKVESPSLGDWLNMLRRVEGTVVSILRSLV